MTPETITMHAGAIVFNGAFVDLMPTVFVGATYILLREFDAKAYIDAIAREKVTQVIGTDQEISHMVALDPQRGRAYTANIGSGSVTAIDLSTGEKLADITTGEGAEGIAGKQGPAPPLVGGDGLRPVHVRNRQELQLPAGTQRGNTPPRSA